MITLTPAAARQLHAAIEDADAEAEGLALRVAARLAEDGALEFGLGFDERREGDFAFDDKGIPMLVGAPSRELLSGTVLDFVEIESGDQRFVLRAADDMPPPTAGEAGCSSGGCSKCGGGC